MLGNINKKIMIGVLSLMFIFSTAVNPINAKAQDNYEEEANRLDDLAYDGDDLGAVYSKESTTFKVWAPTASAVKVNLYSTGSDSEDGAEKLSSDAMTYDETNGVWSVTATGDLNGTYYTYSVTVNDEENETADIYAQAAGVNGNRSMVIDLSSTNPKNWDSDSYVLADSQTDAIVWEVHVGDFSNQKESGIKDEYRGKYLAFTQSGTTLIGNESIPTCIDYLKALGVTHVQINPFYDFGSIDETDSSSDDFNWGYDPKNYNVPEGSYSTDPYNGEVRINETKQMIQALHSAGIGVIMDVVYNHTYTLDDSWFNLTVPKYYYRYNEDGTPSNGSGCGNDTASEHKMFGKYMVDSVTYWAKEYHIDGFRFDLMGLHDTATMNAIRDSLDKIDKRIIMYGEAWSLNTNSTSPLATQSNMVDLSERIGAFNDAFRDGLKGDNFEAVGKGFVQGSRGKTKVQNGILAATTDWAVAPSQTVTYSSCHDNYTLYDKLVASTQGTKGNFRTRDDKLVAMNKLAGAVTLTSQGTAFMLAGEEMARSKDGDHNSYISSKELNQIDWNNISVFGDLTAYYVGLTELRKAYAPFTDAGKTSLSTIKFFEDTDSSVVAYSIENKLDDKWKNVVCIFNGDSENSQDVIIQGDELPENWVVVANDKSAGVQSLGTAAKSTAVTVPKSSAVILVDKESFEKAAIKPNAENAKFQETLTQSVSQSTTENDNKTATVTDDDKGTRDTGNPVIPIIIGGILAACVAVGGVLYFKRSKKK